LTIPQHDMPGRLWHDCDATSGCCSRALRSKTTCTSSGRCSTSCSPSEHCLLSHPSPAVGWVSHRSYRSPARPVHEHIAQSHRLHREAANQRRSSLLGLVAMRRFATTAKVQYPGIQKVPHRSEDSWAWCVSQLLLRLGAVRRNTAGRRREALSAAPGPLPVTQSRGAVTLRMRTAGSVAVARPTIYIRPQRDLVCRKMRYCCAGACAFHASACEGGCREGTAAEARGHRALPAITTAGKALRKAWRLVHCHRGRIVRNGCRSNGTAGCWSAMPSGLAQSSHTTSCSTS
jgi:hypothetical protein